jgi:hypothetical protein
MGAVALVGGLLITSGVTADDDKGKNPFTQILNKLDQILHKLDSGGDGNHTLRWDTNHPSASRFVVLKAFNNQAVLDKNTGLVWEQAPDATNQIWWDATRICVNKHVGGTLGWRTPSVIELASLLDPSLPFPFVPTTVFTGIQSWASYWSATTLTGNLDLAWRVRVDIGGISVYYEVKSNTNPVWCVRGPTQQHEYD